MHYFFHITNLLKYMRSNEVDNKKKKKNLRIQEKCKTKNNIDQVQNANV